MEEEPFSSIRTGRGHTDPERQLFLAILLSAAEELSSPHAATRAAAAYWFQNPHSDAPVSLDAACAALDLDPRRIRRRALKWGGLA